MNTNADEVSTQAVSPLSIMFAPHRSECSRWETQASGAVVSQFPTTRKRRLATGVKPRTGWETQARPNHP